MADNLLTLAEAKNHLRIDSTHDDDTIGDKILSATDIVSEIIRRPILNKAFSDWISCPTRNPFELKRRDLQSLSSITVYEDRDAYIDNSGTDIDDLADIHTICQPAPHDGRIYPLIIIKAEAWPDPGYVWKISGTQGVAAVEKRWKEAAMHILTHLYDNRGVVEWKTDNTIQAILQSDLVYA